MCNLNKLYIAQTVHYYGWQSYDKMNMEHNIGSMDRTTRILFGAVTGLLSLAILASVISLPTVVSPLLGVVSFIMMGTSVTGFCPLYTLLGVDTCSASPQ